MWTAWNDKIQQPQIWDLLHQHDPALTSAVWFPLHSKGCGADYICMPAPIHNPDGSESLWCYTKPTELYGTLRDTLRPFSAACTFGGRWRTSNRRPGSPIRPCWAMQQYRPNFFYIYLPHLDYAAQKTGPDSPAARSRWPSSTKCWASWSAAVDAAYQAPERSLWLVASEYVITPVDHVTYPNRVLREAGLLKVKRRRRRTDRLRQHAAPGLWSIISSRMSSSSDRDAATIEPRGAAVPRPARNRRSARRRRARANTSSTTSGRAMWS